MYNNRGWYSDPNTCAHWAGPLSFVVDSFYLRAFINVRKVFNIDYLDNNIAETNKINDLAVNKPLGNIQ